MVGHVNITDSKSKRHHIVQTLCMWLAYFIVIGSACFQFYISHPELQNLVSMLSKVIFGITLIHYIVFCMIRKISPINKLDCTIILYFGIVCYSSMKNNYDFVYIFPLLMKIFTFKFLLTSYYTRDPGFNLRLFSNAFIVIFLLNLIQMFFFPHYMGRETGEYAYLLTSNRNQLGGIFIPGILVTYMYGADRLNNYFILGICILSMLITRSTTTFVCLIVLLAIYSLRNNKSILIISNYGLRVVLPIFIFIFIIPFLEFNINSLLNDITISLDKDITFSNRTVIWTLTLIQILKNPITGIGLYTKEWAMYYIHGFNSHNLILNALLQAGIIGLGLIVTSFCFAYISIKEISAVSKRRYLYIIMMIFLTMCQFEVYNLVFVFLVLYLFYISPKFLNTK